MVSRTVQYDDEVAHRILLQSDLNIVRQYTQQVYDAEEGYARTLHMSEQRVCTGGITYKSPI